MHSQWLKTEHDRLHIVEQWPDSPRKSATLLAIRSSLANLVRIARSDVQPLCETCTCRQGSTGMVPFLVLTPQADVAAELAA